MSASAAKPKAGSGSRARLLLVLAGVAVLARWTFLAVTGVTFEDSLISLRYAENLASGLGMVYNAGERVFGASTPLYVLFLAALTRAGLPALLTAKVLAALADGVTLYLWGRRLLREGRSVLALLFFALLFGLSPIIVPVSVSGMETSFALLLLSLALLSDMEDREAACGVALGLLMLVRPDGVLAAVVILGFRWRRTRTVPWKAALPALALALSWAVAATWFYGSPIPHSIPAKAAAYNLHRRSIVPNLRDTLSQFFPLAGSPGQLAAMLVLFPCLAAGWWAALWEARLRPLALLFSLWWAYLVLPKTMLFTWYFPPLLLMGYVLAATGFDRVGEWASGRVETPGGEHPAPDLSMARSPQPAIRNPGVWAVGILAVGLCAWLRSDGDVVYRLQRAERMVRREIGIWLREKTPPDARVALEPIGYIGYYSGRRVLDEVGLVSPEMVPLNRAGAGWFPRMAREFQPDYVVERPGFLLRNLTLNSGVPMFAAAGEEEEFLAQYEPVAAFAGKHLPKRLVQDYRFVIYARRSPERAETWRKALSRVTGRARRDFLACAFIGPADLPLRTGRDLTLPRTR